jgi:hypothetical protein
VAAAAVCIAAPDENDPAIDLASAVSARDDHASILPALGIRVASAPTRRRHPRLLAGGVHAKLPCPPVTLTAC